MRSVFRLLRNFFIGLSFVIVFLMGFSFCVLEWPSIILNTHTLKWAAQYSNHKQGMPHVEWDRAQVKINHLALFSNQVNLHFLRLCFEDPELGHGCIEKMNTAFAYGIVHALPRITEIGPVVIRAKELMLNVTPQAAAEHSVTVSSSSKNWVQPDLTQDAKIRPVNIQVGHWSLTLPNLDLGGLFRLDLAPGLSPETGLKLTSEITLLAKSHALGGALDSQSRVVIRGKSPSDGISSDWNLDFNLKALSAKLQAKLDALASLSSAKSQHLVFRVDSNYLSPLGEAKMNMNGWANPGREFHGDIHSQLKPAKVQKLKSLSILSLLQMNKLRLQECHFDFFNPGRDEEDGKVHANCLINATVARFRLYGLLQPPVKLWHELGVVMDADATLPGPKHSKSPINGRIEFTPKSDRLSALRIGGKVTSDFAFMPAEVPVPRKLSTKVDLKFEIENFQQLVKVLSDTPIAVPAPLRALEGNAYFGAKGTVDLINKGRLELIMGSKLDRSPDRLDTDGRGVVTVGPLHAVFDRPPRYPEVNARVKINLADIHMSLPKTGISAPPSQVFPDSRIHTSAPNLSTFVKQNTQSEQMSDIRYLIQVTTPPNHSIEIATEFLKKPLTIGLDLHMEQEQPWIGFAEINGNREAVGIPTSEMAGQVAEGRTGPKLPFGFSELITAFLTGIPLEGVTSQPETLLGVIPKAEEPRISQLLELRRRY